MPSCLSKAFSSYSSSTTPPSLARSKDHPARFTEALPHAVSPPREWEVANFPPLQSFSKLGWMRLASQLTTANSLSVLGATSPGNLMMGDGAAAARAQQAAQDAERPQSRSGQRAPGHSRLGHLRSRAPRVARGWLGRCVWPRRRLAGALLPRAALRSEGGYATRSPRLCPAQRAWQLPARSAACSRPSWQSLFII